MKYIVKKLFTLIITLLFISFLAFSAFDIIGDPVTTLLGTNATPQAIATMRESMGLNRPLPVRYLEWLGQMVSGNFGTSHIYKMPVAEMIGDKIIITFSLTLFSFLLMTALSLPLGICSADREGSLFDRILTITNQVIMSIPPFFIGILLTVLFGIVLRAFSPGNFVSFRTSPGDFILYLFFPALSLAIPRVAMTAKMLRSSILSQMEQDYIRTAISRGNTRRSALWRHALRGAMLPVISFIAVSMAEIVAGGIIIEQIFAVPGIGRLLLSSVSSRDFPVVLAIVVILALWVMLVNFVADILYQCIDPRIRL